MWVLTSGWRDYLIIRFRIRMPEIRGRIRIIMLIISIMLIMERSTADIPIPMITETERNREKRIAKTDALGDTVSQGRAT